jgi:hypothetical protein
MSPEPAASLIEMLQAAQLLESEQLEEVAGALRPRLPDRQALVGEMQKRTWLTPYQAERLLQGGRRTLRCGPFLLLEPLGAGGMGEVFRARHQIIDRVVALKRILPHRLGNQQLRGGAGAAQWAAGLLPVLQRGPRCMGGGDGRPEPRKAEAERCARRGWWRFSRHNSGVQWVRSKRPRAPGGAGGPKETPLGAPSAGLSLGRVARRRPPAGR